MARAKIVLAKADGHGTNEIMRRTGKSKPCVWRWQECYIDEGVEGLMRDKTGPPREPPLPEKIKLAVLKKIASRKSTTAADRLYPSTSSWAVPRDLAGKTTAPACAKASAMSSAKSGSSSRMKMERPARLVLCMKFPRRGQTQLPEKAACLRVAACPEPSVNPHNAQQA